MAEGFTSGFTSGEILAMQKDAVRRVNEMQRIAQEKLKNTPISNTMPLSDAINSSAVNINNTMNNIINQPNNAIKPPLHNDAGNLNSHSQPQSNSHSQPHSHQQADAIVTYRDDSNNEQLPLHNHDCMPINAPASGFAGILQQLNLDDEKIIIILLLILLVNEGADTMLILALVYILL